MTNTQVFESYIQSIASKFSYEETSEMGYRADFENLLKTLFESINITRFDHDAKAINGNKPDFVVRKNNIPLLYIEVKDIGIQLDKIEKSEQMSRYFGYSNLVLTDYCEFRFYRNGLPYCEPIKIATVDKLSRTVTSKEDNFSYLQKTLLDFVESQKEPIKSGKHLAKIMGGKALRIRDNLRLFLNQKSETNIEIEKVYEAIKRMLVHDLTPDNFTDMYAQTLVYGLFVARYYDETLSTFTRQEARDLIPNTNPFLRHFFDHIAGPNFDKRLEYIVDELCEVFTHANIQELMKEYFKEDLWGGIHSGPDPVIHFYEDFLKEYDPELRKKMGAYYTPKPVVHFIVYSIDSILKKFFGLPSGLADTQKLADNTHRVQILDPATGTGTFIGAIIGAIYGNFQSGSQQGRWPSYVHNDLLPRVHGFELMMAPYTIAHLKLAMAFRQTGFKYFNRRLGIYLTNTLETGIDQPALFTTFGLADSIAEESKEASLIKTKTPIMVVIGNPPYSVSSPNKGKWITELIKDYKIGLNERNIQPLSDDYIKFLRYAEHFVEKSKYGIVAMITNNSFIDGITHRQMRKHLLETFENIYILNLHGNSKKKETTPDGKKDENVFDIQQGVSINIFIRRAERKVGLGEVAYADLYGKREEKFKVLNDNLVQDIRWQKVNYSAPYYFFVPKNLESKEEYDKGFKLNDLFNISGSGIKFRKDNLLVKCHFDSNSVEQMLQDFQSIDENSFHYKYNFKDTEDWKLKDKKQFFRLGDTQNIKPVSYRPFDTRYTYYPLTEISNIIPRGDARKPIMKNLLLPNIALAVCRQLSTFDFQHIFCTRNIADMCFLSSQTKEAAYLFPLFTYDNNGIKTSNLNSEIAGKFMAIVSGTDEEQIFNYVYSVLHSTTYRRKYNEFLKIEFPRIPYPKDQKSFKKIAELGSQLRQIHLLESPVVDNFITTYPIAGNDTVEITPIYKDSCVYINTTQYFGNIPEKAWGFYIGGYQPAQKWLKDRKGHTLTSDDLEHYQKIIVALNETLKVMEKIEEVWEK